MSQTKDSELSDLIRESRRLGDARDYEKQLPVLESICQLKANDLQHQSELALCHIRTGDLAAAARLMASAILAGGAQTGKYKTLFIVGLSGSPLNGFNADYKQALHQCLEDPYDCEIQALMASWLFLLINAPATSELKHAMNIVSEHDFQEWLQSDSTAVQTALNDDFLIDGLCSLIMANPLFEIFLTRIRRFLCLNIKLLESTGGISAFRRLLLALAQQCYINEFVFLVEKEELEVVEKLRLHPDNLSENEIALLACYQPLHDVIAQNVLEKILENASDEEFLSLIRTQYLNRRDEKINESSIEVFGTISNSVSTDVKSQYEESPYPRWLSVSRNSGPLDDTVADIKQACRLLVAGCGTGQHAISAAARHPNATVVAIDLSKTSLGYAKRKAMEAGFSDRIQFVQADILSMKDWPEQFDIIECCGVLHHMEDPVAGWKTLSERLKPGGHFKVALYSKTARLAVTQARDYIKKTGLTTSTESIRKIRYVIFSEPAGSTVREFFIPSVDFYTSSRVRDAIFNVQEHQFDLNEISDIIDKLGLEFVRFTLNRASISRLYKDKFRNDPKQTDLRNWAQLEAERPGLFAGMYQFWLKKPVK